MKLLKNDKIQLVGLTIFTILGSIAWFSSLLGVLSYGFTQLWGAPLIISTILLIILINDNLKHWRD